MSVFGQIKAYFNQLGSISEPLTFDYKNITCKAGAEAVYKALVAREYASGFPIEEGKVPIYLELPGRSKPKKIGIWRYAAAPELCRWLVFTGTAFIKKKYVPSGNHSFDFRFKDNRAAIYLVVL